MLPLCFVALIGVAGHTLETNSVAQRSAAKLEDHWNDLASRCKPRAALAMLDLAKSPRETAALLKERLRPVKIDGKKVAQWLTDLDSDDLDTQCRAIDNLEYCGKYIRADLDKALKDASRAETKQIVEQLQKKLPPNPKLPQGDNYFFQSSASASNGTLTCEIKCDRKGNFDIRVNGITIDSSSVLGAAPIPWVQAERAVTILEHLGTAEATQILETLALGEADASPTVAARAALKRQKNDLDQQKLWAELANQDERKAMLAMLALAAKPREAIALFKENLKPIDVDPKHVGLQLSRLASDNYVVRNRATQELELCGPLIRKNLEEAHKDAKTLELRRRLEELLAKLPKTLRVPGERGGIETGLHGVDVFAQSTLDGRVVVKINDIPIDWDSTLGRPPLHWERISRAITILENFGDTDARRLLELVATGGLDAPPTHAARAALWRLTRN